MLDAPVTYNGIDLNTIEDVGNGVRKGCLLEEFDYGRSQGVGYTEKRSQDDGMDASDVYMSQRIISLSGIVYGEDTADLFDRLQVLRTAFTPTVTYAFDKPDYGYIPLEFSLPTHDARFDVAGVMVKQLEYRCRPTGQPQFSIRRDQGAFPNRTAMEFGGGINWNVTLECKDPRLYVRPDIWVPFTAAVTSQPLVNRGDYPAPVDVLLGVTSSLAGSKVEIDVGGSTLIITLGALTNATVRYSGELKVLTLQTSGATTDTLRMDMLSFGSTEPHPKVPPGNSTYSVRKVGTSTLSAGTRLMYSESFA